MAPRTAADRIETAEKFLKMGLEELKTGRRKVDLAQIREGAEKVFHALVEAANARLIKYGVPPAGTHRETVAVLKGIDKELARTYEEAFSRLHVLTYYQGIVDIDKVEPVAKDVEKAVVRVRKYVRGR